MTRTSGHLYYCRHGLSELGARGLWAGSTDSPLTDEGRQQAIRAGEHARTLAIDRIITSPLSRARETAELIAAEIGYPLESIYIDERTIERNFGILEGTAYDPTFDVGAVAGVEPLDSLMRRAREFYAHLQTLEAHNILVVSHGSFGRALRNVIDPRIPFRSESFENARIVRLS